MLQLKLEEIIRTLKEFTSKYNTSLEIIIIGGLALHYYGLKNRATVDIDAEVKGNVETLSRFLKAKKIPSDIGENISTWSVVDMPHGYRQRAIIIFKEEKLAVKVLSPVDFIIAKLRRFSEEDIKDILFVAKKFKVGLKDIENKAEDAIKHSPKDTELFIFGKNLKFLLEKLRAS